jgi:predicted outer membrane repeat protein
MMQTGWVRSLAARGGVLLVFFLGLAGGAAAQVRWYVDAGAAAGGDGLSWATAFRSPSEALANSIPGDDVWVKAGTYTVDTPLDVADPRSATFDIPAGVWLRGGFDGTETQFSERARLFDQTILTGDLGVQGDISDNAYWVVNAVFPSGIPPGATRLNGFTIRDGNNDHPYGQGSGVHMFNVALVIKHCTIRNNRSYTGAGVHAQPAALRVSWSRFIDNVSLDRGGAIWGQALNCKVSHTTFSGNQADRGGAIYLHSTGNSTPGLLPISLIHNSVFHDNHARLGGAIFLGGASFSSGKATISSCTLAYNSATGSGGGIWAGTGAGIPAESTLHNSIVWFNSAPIYPNLRGRHAALACNFEDGAFYGTRNISSDPMFADGPGRDFRLTVGSPSIDVGGNILVPTDFADADADGTNLDEQSLDLDRRRRFRDEPSQPDLERYIDMGAYEN